MAKGALKPISAPKIDAEIGTRYLAGDELPLDQIRTDGGTQARQALNDATVDEYAQAMEDGAQFPLLIVYHDGESHWLADGFHRLAAARKAGRERLRVDVRMGDKRAAILYAVGANDAHGLRRTSADKRRAVATLLRDTEWSRWSDSTIAKQVKVDHKTVASVRAELVATGEIPGSSVRQSADGKLRDVSGISTANAARKQPAASPPEHPRIRPASCIRCGAERTQTRSLTSYQAGLIDAYPDRDVTLCSRCIPELLAAQRAAEQPASHEVAAPFWQSIDAHHPTAHLWTRERPDLLRSACGMTIQNRVPSGNTEAGHCSSCVRATWPQSQAVEVQEQPKIKEVAPDDHIQVAAIERQAEELGMQVAWEDDQVILYWAVADIDGLAPMRYTDALEWLTDAFMQRDKPPRARAPASDSAGYAVAEAADQLLIASGNMGNIQVATWQAAQAERASAIDYARTFAADRRAAMQKWATSAMVNQLDYRRALDQIDALLALLET